MQSYLLKYESLAHSTERRRHLAFSNMVPHNRLPFFAPLTSTQLQSSFARFPVHILQVALQHCLVNPGIYAHWEHLIQPSLQPKNHRSTNLNLGNVSPWRHCKIMVIQIVLRMDIVLLPRPARHRYHAVIDYRVIDGMSNHLFRNILRWIQIVNII